MKALIIENEFDIPGEITGFIKDSKLFTEVNEQTACEHRGLEDIARFIAPADAIIVMSTFMYKNQLEEYVQALASKKLGAKKIFCFRILRNLHDWFINEDDSFYFDDFASFRKNLISLVTEQGVYDVLSDKDAKESIFDNYWDGVSCLGHSPDECRNRDPWISKKICYDKEANMFYHEGSSAKGTIEYFK